MADSLAPIRSEPGIQRDGTRFDSKAYIDGTWCRFQRGLPRKIGGYISVTNSMAEKIYGLHSFTVNATQYMHLGSASLLTQRRINNLGVQTGFDDRTPAGLVPTESNIWQFDAIFDVDVGDTILVAHAAPNMDIASDDEQPIWFGQLTAATPLIDTTYPPVSGGLVTIGNYVVGYGSGGYVVWNSTPNNIDAGTEEDFITQQKIIKGLQVRGGGVPAGLLWSLDSLIIQSLSTSGGGSTWDWDTIGEISVMSSRGIIEYDGVYYWPGVDRWLSYNGVIREIPNVHNVNFFFEQINMLQRQKVFAYKVPRFGEIWWFFPLGEGQEECNHAVIFNVREGYWYDTPIPENGRTDGIYAKVYFKPFLCGAEAGGAGYTLWQHETGRNKVVGASVEPIQSFFETAEMSLISSDKPEDSELRVGILEPDFVQSGDLEITLNGRANARAALQSTDPVTVTEQQESPAGVPAEEQAARFKRAFRLMSFKVESNEPDGDYQMGQVVAHINKAGQRSTQ